MVAWLRHPLSNNGIQFYEKCGTRSRPNTGYGSTMGSGEATPCNAKKISNVAPDLSTRKSPRGSGLQPFQGMKPRIRAPGSGLFFATQPPDRPGAARNG